jgi:uncharacterized SAM-binding protein YcdF (DUF218 family)
MPVRQDQKFGRKRKATLRRRFLVVAALLLVATPLIAWGAARLLIVKADMESADAIIVLSGSSTYVERAARAAELYQAGRAPVVVLTNDGVISGWDHKEERNPYYYELSKKRMEQFGVPSDRITVAPGQAVGTYDESVLIRDFATAQGWKRLLIVTSGYHSRRAFWSMRRACEGSGIEVGINSAPTGWQTPSPWLWWSKTWGWKLVAGEYLKMIYYWTKY